MQEQALEEARGDVEAAKLAVRVAQVAHEAAMVAYCNSMGGVCACAHEVSVYTRGGTGTTLKIHCHCTGRGHCRGQVVTNADHYDPDETQSFDI